ncbi:NXPE family member 3-like [Babylonia areolata]|uniref:NXPE family member 3-like n=1 Tax=Babylonia areolata TaxID=304850 RepID=UPI003FCF8C36
MIIRWETVVSYFSIGSKATGSFHYPLPTPPQTPPPTAPPDDLVLQVDDLGVKSSVQVKVNTLGPERVVERIDTSGLGREGGYSLLSRLVRDGQLDYRRVAKYPIEHECLTSMDLDSLADGPVTNLTTVASTDRTVVELVGVKQTRKVQVGENITIRVIVKDAVGRPVLKGGHQVRVWMISKGKTPRSAAAHVTGLRNGTYVASLPVLWPGLTEVRAALLRPREFRRLVLSLMTTMKIMIGIVSSFVSNKTEEVTLCSSIPVVPGYQEVCNLTTLNSGMSWYCGRPSTPGLKCRDWAWSTVTSFPQRYPLSDTENDLMHQILNKRADCLEKLKQTISLNAVQDKGQQKRLDKKACRPLKPRETWEDRQSPGGYWENNTWRPLIGCPLPELSESVVLDCLHDTHFIAIGDSNIRAVIETLQRYTRCHQQPDPLSSYHPNMLHVPLIHHCPSQKLWISWYPHAYPLYSGQHKWSDVKVKNAPHRILDTLPATGKYVIAIHLFAHFSQVHSHMYMRHTRETARAVRALIKRNPSVKVFIRGPHAMVGKLYTLQADMFPARCLCVLRQEFRDLKNHVVLLNMLEMTVANENCPVHPVQKVVTTTCRSASAQQHLGLCLALYPESSTWAFRMKALAFGRTSAPRARRRSWPVASSVTGSVLSS